MEPKAIQDEMGEVFDEFGRMSAKLGLEMAKTTALNPDLHPAKLRRSTHRNSGEGPGTDLEDHP